jgi:exodeoxyribonuclease V alpha subunit
MTVLDRTAVAGADRHLVTSATGLLAAFNDAGVLGPLDVHAAEAVARITGETDESVILAAALAVRGPRIGHVCIEPATQREAVVVDGQDPEVVEALPWPDPGEWQAAVAASAIVGDGSGDEPMVLQDGRLYLERYFRYEEQVADLILNRVATPPISFDPRFAAVLDRVLPDEAGGNRQRTAVETALTSRFTVIAGGPGTGKTYTVAALLATLASGADGELPTVGLCAPTGKAAARLTEAVEEYTRWVDDPVVRDWLERIEALTIHRLLGWSPLRGRFRHDARNPVPYDWVIVDEMSMVSLPQAAKLMEAVPDGAPVVLVGDPFQLTSIEAGTVLADIVGPAVDPSANQEVSGAIADRVVVLDRVHRFEEQGAIADLAAAIRTGDADGALAVLGGGDASVQWIPDRSSPRFGEMWDRVVEDRAEMVREADQPDGRAGALQRLTGLAILCAHRRGAGSVARWQRDIETALDEQFTGLRYHGEWYPGRPVMITTNDYNLSLFNGDIGVAVRTDDGLRVVFERGGQRLFAPSHLGERTTVHALTIHKSQGSQFDEVIVVLPQEGSRLLTRELLYTAVTRASGQVTILGDETVVRQAVERSVERASGLGPRLWR